MASFTPGVDRWLRHVGASIIAAGALFSAPFVLWALAYKTYIYAETGHSYAWGAPTQIGVCNRIISYALVVLSVIGITFLGAGHVMALVRRRRAAAPRSHSPIIGATRR